MSTIPRPPVGAPLTSHVWMEWFRKIYDGIVNPSNVSWGSINFTGSDLSDIATRPHNVLQSIQGGTSGEYYHLKQSEHTFYTGLKQLKTTGSLNFGSILAQTCAELTITVTGAATGDTVTLGAPNNIN